MAIPLWIRRVGARIEAATNGYLCQIGWVETRARFRAVSVENKPIPWFTYPAVRFFQDRVKPEWRVLEFGAGMGTLWWSESVEQIVSLEHDAGWFEHISGTCTANLIKTTAESADGYIHPALSFGHFDLVVVDGLFRAECLRIAPRLLADRGVVVLDDAQRCEYKDSVRFLLDMEFRVLEFHGPQPVNKHPGCTAIFYRNQNVLDI